jgi:hypothetical protein
MTNASWTCAGRDAAHTISSAMSSGVTAQVELSARTRPHIKRRTRVEILVDLVRLRLVASEAYDGELGLHKTWKQTLAR